MIIFCDFDQRRIFTAKKGGSNQEIGIMEIGFLGKIYITR